jgi:hypothetical protein
MVPKHDVPSALKVNPVEHLVQVELVVQLSQSEMQSTHFLESESKNIPMSQVAQDVTPAATVQVLQPKLEQDLHDIWSKAG